MLSSREKVKGRQHHALAAACPWSSLGSGVYFTTYTLDFGKKKLKVTPSTPQANVDISSHRGRPFFSKCFAADVPLSMYEH